MQWAVECGTGSMVWVSGNVALRSANVVQELANVVLRPSRAPNNGKQTTDPHQYLLIALPFASQVNSTSLLMAHDFVKKVWNLRW